MNAPALSREQLRSRRKREVRARTELTYRIGKRRLEQIRSETDYPVGVWRPRTRGDCIDAPRPCPFVSCKWNLYLDVSPRNGALKLNFPDIEPCEMPPSASCALDVADRGGTTLEDLGAIMNLTRERIRQVEAISLAKIETLHDAGLLDHVERGPVGKHRLPVVDADVETTTFEDDIGDPPLDASGWRNAPDDAFDADECPLDEAEWCG